VQVVVVAQDVAVFERVVERGRDCVGIGEWHRSGRSERDSDTTWTSLGLERDDRKEAATTTSTPTWTPGARMGRGGRVIEFWVARLFDRCRVEPRPSPSSP
jgi:hypothetical protein